MRDKNLNLISNKLVNAFLKNKIISPIPRRYTKKLKTIPKDLFWYKKNCFWYKRWSEATITNRWAQTRSLQWKKNERIWER